MDNVILSVDALYPPLTGIGKYTAFLADGLLGSERFDSVKYFDNGRWIGDQEVAYRISNYSQKISSGGNRKFLANLRRSATQSNVVMGIYASITPYLFSRKLAPYSSTHLYHSPNFIAPTFAGKKITTFHDLSIIRYPHFHPEARVRFLKKAMRKSINESDLIIVDSMTVRDEILEFYGVGEDRVKCVPLASTLSDSDFPLAAEKLFSDQKLTKKQYIISVATVEPRKNLGTIIQAYASLDDDIKSQFPLVVIGDSGWKSREVHSDLDSGTLQNIHYLGYVGDQELTELYRNATLFVFASVYEGFGLPCLEAQLLGVPALVSDIPVLREVTGGHARFFSPTDKDALADLIRKTVLGKEDNSALINAARLHARGFTWSRTVNELLDIYHAI